MIRTGTALVAATLLLIGTASTAAAAPGDALPGYTFCGWKNFSDGSWSMANPESGAFLTAYASGMTCRAARQNVTRLRTTSRPPYSPLRTGYRCVELVSGYEYSSIRCVKRGGRAKFRSQTGA